MSYLELNIWRFTREANKVEESYILILPQAFLAVLDVRSAVDDLLRGLRCVFLVCNLSTEKVTGLRWVREGIGRVNLPGESLIQRSHITGPVQIKQLTACQSHTHGSGVFSLFWGGRSIGFLCASRRTDGRQPVFTSGLEQRDKVKMPS